MDETHTGEVATSAPGEDTVLDSADRTVGPLPVPPHAVEAAATYLAELDDLLAHVAAHPDERWVAYRGRQRLGFGINHRALLGEWRVKFPDGRFNVYGIEACDKCPDDTVV